MLAESTRVHLPVELSPDVVRSKLDLLQPLMDIDVASIRTDLQDHGRGFCSTIDADDLDKVQRLFPRERRPDTILALTIWLWYACKIDDYLESLPPEQARKALMECRLEFETALSDRCITNAVTTNLGISMTRYLLSNLRRVCSLQKDGDRVMRTMMEVLEGFEEEVSYLNDVRLDTERYIQIRNKTISVKPFFAILALGIDMTASACGASNVADKLRLLEDEISIMIGLQNDLLGLLKDIEGQSMMNFVLIHSGHAFAPLTSSSIDTARLGVGTQAAIERHNLASARASRLHQDIVSRGSDSIRQYSCQLFALPLLHSGVWMSSRRYHHAYR